MSISRFFSATRRFTVTAVLVGLMSVGLTACGGDNPAPAATNTPGQSTGTAQEFRVALNEWSIEPKNLEVSAGKARFLVSNNGQFPHDLTIITEGTPKTPAFTSADGVQNLDVDLKAGTYTWLCSIGDHASKGMTGELVVK